MCDEATLLANCAPKPQTLNIPKGRLGSMIAFRIIESKRFGIYGQQLAGKAEGKGQGLEVTVCGYSLDGPKSEACYHPLRLILSPQPLQEVSGVWYHHIIGRGYLLSGVGRFLLGGADSSSD